MPKYYYWEDILDLTPEVEEECSKALDQIRNEQTKSAGLEELTGYNLYSVRAGYRKRLLFTVINVGGHDYLKFLELSLNHYEDSRIMKNPKLLKKFRKSRKKTSSETLTWESADDTQLKGVIHSDISEAPAPLRWYNHHLIALTGVQREVQNIAVPALISGLAGSGKTSTVLLSLPKLSTQYNAIVCIANTPLLRNDMQSAWNSLPQAMEPDSRVEFLTWIEWAERSGLNLSGKTLAGESEFKVWYRENVHKIARIARQHGVTPSKLVKAQKTSGTRQHDLQADAEASAIYQEMRIACGYTPEAYQALGTCFSLFSTGSADRQFVHEWLLPAWEKYCARAALVDPSFVQLEPGELDGLLVVEEAQDFSCRQLRDLLRFSGSKLQFIACAGEYQRLNDSLPFVNHLQQMVYEAGTELTRVVLPGSFRVPAVLEGAVQLLIDWSVFDAGGVQDKAQVRTFESTLGPHALPGSAHWFECDKIPADLLQSIRVFGANNPEFAVVTSPDPEHVDEARRVFGEDVFVTTIEAIKGMQFKTGVHYRLLDTPRAEHLCAAREAQQAEGASSSAYRPKNRRGNWQNATTYHRLFTAYTRFSERLIIMEASVGKYKTALLSNALRAKIPERMPLSLTHETVDTSPEAWAKRVRQFIRQGSIDTARRLFIEKCKGRPEEFTTLMARFERRVEPAMPAQPEAQPSSSSSSSSSTSSSSTDAHIVSPSKTPALPSVRPAASRRGKGPKRGMQRMSHANGTTEKQLLAKLFNPVDSEIAEIINQSDKKNPDLTRIFERLTKPVNLLPWISLEQFGMQFSLEPKAVRSSMMYWVFNYTSIGRSEYLEKLLKESPQLINALADYCRQLHLAKEPMFDARFSDLRYLILLRQKPGLCHKLLQAINTRAGFRKDSDTVIDVSLQHLPLVCHRICSNLYLLPQDEWESYIRAGEEWTLEWVGYLVHVLKERAAHARADWHKCAVSDDVMQQVRKFLGVGQPVGIPPGEDKNSPFLRMHKKARTCTSPLVMMKALNKELKNCGKNWFRPAYVELYVAREGIREAISRPALKASEPRVSSSAVSFFQGHSGAQSTIQQSGESRYQFPKDASTVTLETLFTPNADALREGRTSFLDWLCAGDSPVCQFTLVRLLTSVNSRLTEAFIEVLRQNVLAGNFDPKYLDVQCLAMIVDTDAGGYLIALFAQQLNVAPAELLQAIAAYYPKACDPWSQLLHFTLESEWNTHVTAGISEQPLYAKYPHVYARLQKLYSLANQRGKGLWDSCASSPFLRDNLLNALAFLKLPDSKISDCDRALVNRLSEQLEAMENTDIEAITALVGELRADPLLHPAGMLAGFIRAFCDHYLLVELRMKELESQYAQEHHSI
ncbi:hypothetical protein E3226_001190 [Legionella geestiana]|uniref:hypothetical protein n=1 Tax=Legionella geestiana TaxID=45065 RepID=UPI0010930812|nr:hypothetical protein [Legionella geestiana]QDQ39115.1 hypothetical protein E3226_001190 [Legionella geestiana]